MKMWKRMISMLAVLAMLVSVCGAIAESLAAATPEVSMAADGSAAPTLDPENMSTLDPESTIQPEGIEPPMDVADPSATPNPTVLPENTQAPAEENGGEDEPQTVAEESGLDGKTDPVDNSTTLVDGSYVPENFSYSGGSGKTTISCPQVTVSGGKAMATIIFSSSSWEYVKASGNKYDAKLADGKASFEIPAALNEDNTIIAMTSAMSTAKEVTYTIHIALSETASSTTPVPEETQAPLEDGDYTIGIESDFKMFKISASSAVVTDGKVIVTISTSSASYDKIYLGSKEDAEKTPYITGVSNAGGGYDFTFELPKAYMGQTVDFVPSKADGTWYEKNQYHLTIPAALEKVETTPEPEPSVTPVPDMADGDYNVNVESSAAMFKIVSCVLTAKDGAYTAVITMSGTGYDKIYMGSAEAAATADEADYIAYATDAEGKYTFTLPVKALDTPIAIAAHSASKDSWYDRTLTFKSEGAEKVEKKVEDGDYNVNVESSAAMFKIVSCVLTAKDGAYTAVITMSGTGYDKIYMGSAEAAATADEADCIAYAADANGKYTFTLPVAALDTPIAIAAHSASKDTWYDRTLTFKSEGMEQIGTAEPTPTPEPTVSPEPTETAKPEDDLSGSTSKVDSSTALKDGVYTPDKFSYSGGSGRVSISCSKVTVSGGKATAMLAFSSTSIAYVKANGKKYYPSVSGGSSYFNIPVNLNSNNKIIGMTTAMSADHEVTYTIYIYIEGADDTANDSQEAKAAEVVGLTYESTDTIENAQLFAIYRYKDGFVAIDVQDVGRYILVPEGAEVPVGLDEGATLIQMPVQHAYVASDAALRMLVGMESEELMQKIAAVACTQENLAMDPSMEILVQRMAEEMTVYAGEAAAPEYAALLKVACDMAILPETFCVTEEDALTDEEQAALNEVTERLEMLGIPAFVDRSADEETEEAKLEWIKVYGVMFGCEEAAQQHYEQAIALLKEAA